MINEKQKLEILYCAAIEGGTVKDFMALAKQAEKIAKQLDPEKYTAEKMRCFLEPHFEGVVRKSGDLWIGRNHIGKKCFGYFAGKND